LAAIASSTSLAEVGDEVLIPTTPTTPAKELARHRAGALGHRAPLLMTRMDPQSLAESDHTVDQARVARSARSVTMEFPDLVAWSRSPEAKA